MSQTSIVLRDSMSPRQFEPLLNDYLIVVSPAKRRFLKTSHPSGDRVCLPAPTLEHALGRLFQENPNLKYADVVGAVEI